MCVCACHQTISFKNAQMALCYLFANYYTKNESNVLLVITPTQRTNIDFPENVSYEINEYITSSSIDMDMSKCY